MLLEALLEQFEHEQVRVLPGRSGQPLDHRRVDPDLVVLDVVPVDLHGRLEVFVHDLVMERGQVLDHPVAEPFLHHGEVPEPLVIDRSPFARDPHRNQVRLARSAVVSLPEDRRKRFVNPLPNRLD